MTRPPPGQRKSLGELAAVGRKGGLICPRCGCRDFTTVKTIQGDGHVQRRRQCRHCGERITTIEAP